MFWCWIVVVLIKLRHCRKIFTCEICEILNLKFIHLFLYFDLTFVFRFVYFNRFFFEIVKTYVIFVWNFNNFVLFVDHDHFCWFIFVFIFFRNSMIFWIWRDIRSIQYCIRVWMNFLYYKRLKTIFIFFFIFEMFESINELKICCVKINLFFSSTFRFIHYQQNSIMFKSNELSHQINFKTLIFMKILCKINKTSFKK